MNRTSFVLLALVALSGCRQRAPEERGADPPAASTSGTAPASQADADGAGAGPACSPLAATEAGRTVRTVAVDGDERTYVLHAPASRGPAPLILSFHGLGQSTEGAERHDELAEKAKDRGYLVAYPEGRKIGPAPACWNAGGCCAPCDILGSEDVAFVRALIADVRASRCVDADRVYAVGFSNGAMMAHRLACAAGSDFAAVAAVSGTMLAPECEARVEDPPSVLIAHGTADRQVPYLGGAPKFFVDLPLDWPGVAKVSGRWSDLLGCEGDPRTDTLLNRVTRSRHDRCSTGQVLEVVTIDGGVHHWPRGDFELTNHVLAFFEEHRKNRR